VLKADDREYQAGDRILCLKNQSRVGVLNGDLATVSSVDLDKGALTVRLDRHPEPTHLPAWYLHDGHVDHGYAVTCHKAQGATVERTFVVASDAITREWGYVGMSRGRQANTLYLANPTPDEDCTHLAHERPDEIVRLAATLGRSEAQAAAIDTGRGPQTIDDDQLRQRLDEIEAAIDTSTDDPAQPRHDLAQVVEYADLTNETEARHRDGLAAITYQPPSWVAETLGERPATPTERVAWNRAVDIALRYRTQHHIPEHHTGVPGPRPPSSNLSRYTEWIATRRAIDHHLARLERDRDRTTTRAL